jgi:hypothetical protein
MRSFWFVIAVCAGLVSSPPYSAAFSTTDQGRYQNNDGTPKFADPDEQTPAFIVTPSDSGARDSAASFGDSNTSMPTPRDAPVYIHRQNWNNPTSSSND